MEVSGSHVLYFVLGILISLIYHLAIYREVVSLNANPELCNQFLHPKTFMGKMIPLIKLISIFGLHMLCGWLYFKSMKGILIANFVVAEIVLFLPFNTLMSTPFIKSLGKLTCGISVIIQLLVFMVLKIGGVL